MCHGGGGGGCRLSLSPTEFEQQIPAHGPCGVPESQRLFSEHRLQSWRGDPFTPCRRPWASALLTPPGRARFRPRALALMMLEPVEKPGAGCPFPLPPGVWPGFPQRPGFQEPLACPSLLPVVQPSLARPSQVWKLFSETWRSPSAAGVVVPVQSTHQVTPPWVMRRGQLGAGDGWLCPLPTLPRDPDSTVSPEPRPGAGVAGEGPSPSPGVSWQGLAAGWNTRLLYGLLCATPGARSLWLCLEALQSRGWRPGTAPTAALLGGTPPSPPACMSHRRCCCPSPSRRPEPWSSPADIPPV